MAQRRAKATNIGGSSVDRVQQHLRAMAVAYAFKPGERINEGALARSLGVSRTPVREALNRLSIEGLLEVRAGAAYRDLPAVVVVRVVRLASHQCEQHDDNWNQADHG